MKFSIGDRVKIFDVDITSGVPCTDTGTVNGVSNKDDGQAVRVLCDTWKNDKHPDAVYVGEYVAGNWFHSRQCKKLKKKARGKPREYWIYDNGTTLSVFENKYSAVPDDYKLFREVTE